MYTALFLHYFLSGNQKSINVKSFNFLSRIILNKGYSDVLRSNIPRCVVLKWCGVWNTQCFCGPQENGRGIFGLDIVVQPQYSQFAPCRHRAFIVTPSLQTMCEFPVNNNYWKKKKKKNAPQLRTLSI